MTDQPTIYLVEDNNFYRHMLQAELEAAGYSNVTAFTEGKACLEALDQMPDIVLLDHQLPQESGLAILQEIKAFDPDIQVIFLSGQQELDVAVQTLKYGAFDYVMKNDHAFGHLALAIQRALPYRAQLTNWRRKEQRKQRITNALLTATAVGLLATALAHLL